MKSDPVNQKHDQGAKVYDFNLNEEADDVDPALRCKWWVGRGRGVMRVDDDQDNDDYPKVMTFQRLAAKDNDDWGDAIADDDDSSHWVKVPAPRV